MAKRHKHRLRLFGMFKNCFHCGAPLIFEDKENPNNPNIATLENKYSTWESARHRQSKNEFRYRLVCLKCSRERSESDIKTVPVEILRDMAGAYPLGHHKNNISDMQLTEASQGTIIKEQSPDNQKQ